MPFVLQHRIKGHARIIWGLSWSADGSCFATASRDGTVKLWLLKNISSSSKPLATITPGQAVTAIAFAPHDLSAQKDDTCVRHEMALGLESGEIQIWRIARADSEVTMVCWWQSSEACSHCAPVRRICWQAENSHDTPQTLRHLRMATCADDHCVRIFQICNTRDGL